MSIFLLLSELNEEQKIQIIPFLYQNVTQLRNSSATITITSITDYSYVSTENSRLLRLSDSKKMTDENV